MGTLLYQYVLGFRGVGEWELLEGGGRQGLRGSRGIMRVMVPDEGLYEDYLTTCSFL